MSRIAKRARGRKRPAGWTPGEWDAQADRSRDAAHVLAEVVDVLWPYMPRPLLERARQALGEGGCRC